MLQVGYFETELRQLQNQMRQFQFETVMLHQHNTQLKFQYQPLFRELKASKAAPARGNVVF